ncbi:MAG: hypothetical protein CL526_05860 [Aequorivita sp.]|nr:hypothetical protein [Aequorivita sp.]
MKKGRLSQEERKNGSKKNFGNKQTTSEARHPVLDLAHEKRQAFTYLFCPKSYHRPNLLTSYGKFKYNSTFFSNYMKINIFR